MDMIQQKLALKERLKIKKIMAQSLSRVILHIVFSTKGRAPLINNAIRPKLHAYIAAVTRSLGSQAFRVGGTEDHVHIACTLPRTLNQGDLLKKIKTSSSKWAKEQGINSFYWQDGYGVFSIGQSQLPQLLQNIDNQEEHHRKKGFKQEYKDFLDKYDIEYNENYVWDE